MSANSESGERDDASFAWRRFRRILGYMNIVALAVAGAVAAYLRVGFDTLPWVFIALILVGVYATMMMAAALMGLMFMSSGTGHDEKVLDFAEGAHPLDD